MRQAHAWCHVVGLVYRTRIKMYTCNCLFVSASDHDGSASLRGKPTLVCSWPTWWNLGPDCSYNPLYNAYWCDYYPWRTVARLEVRVPGYTVPVGWGRSVVRSREDSGATAPHHLG